MFTLFHVVDDSRAGLFLFLFWKTPEGAPRTAYFLRFGKIHDDSDEHEQEEQNDG